MFGVVLRLCLAPSPAKARMLSHEEREWLQQEQDAARAATAAASGGRQRRGTLSEWGLGAWESCSLLSPKAAVAVGLRRPQSHEITCPCRSHAAHLHHFQTRHAAPAPTLQASSATGVCSTCRPAGC